MKKRRLLSLFLCAAMVMSLCAVGTGAALAADGSATACPNQAVSITLSSSTDQTYTFTSEDGARVTASLTGTSKSGITIGNVFMGTYGKTYSVSMSEIGTHELTIRGSAGGTNTYELTVIPHSYTASTTAATCTASGRTTYTCSNCGDSYYETIPATGHTAVTDAAVDPSCTATGLTEGSHCSVCNTVLTAQGTIPALGHSYDNGAIMTEATCTEEGKMIYTCTVCAETMTEAIPMVQHTLVTVPAVEATEEQNGNIEYYVCDVCGALFLDAEGTQETTLEEVITKLLCAIDVFDDITDTTAWYYDAVDYVYHAGIMTGTSATEFSPDLEFSRAQMVTVLYRLAGEPDVSGVENPFTDVSADDWYYNEVLWAYSTGVTTGTSDTTFEPDTDVSREQVITFLYRYTTMIEERDISEEPVSDLKDYEDVDKVDSWALDAVQWSVGNGIVQGTSATTLEPQNNADRATAAQMLYNYLDGYLG